MQCPSCKDVSLVMSERQGVEIDYCPKCRGIWLDRGELDKLIEQSERLLSAARNTAAAPPPPPPQGFQQPPPQQYAPPPQHQQPYPPQQHYPPQQPPPFQYRPDLDDSKYGYKYKKRKSFWSEIFD